MPVGWSGGEAEGGMAERERGERRGGPSGTDQDGPTEWIAQPYVRPATGFPDTGPAFQRALYPPGLGAVLMGKREPGDSAATGEVSALGVGRRFGRRAFPVRGWLVSLCSPRPFPPPSLPAPKTHC